MFVKWISEVCRKIKQVEETVSFSESQRKMSQGRSPGDRKSLGLRWWGRPQRSPDRQDHQGDQLSGLEGFYSGDLLKGSGTVSRQLSQDMTLGRSHSELGRGASMWDHLGWAPSYSRCSQPFPLPSAWQMIPSAWHIPQCTACKAILFLPHPCKHIKMQLRENDVVKAVTLKSL